MRHGMHIFTVETDLLAVDISFNESFMHTKEGTRYYPISTARFPIPNDPLSFPIRPLVVMLCAVSWIWGSLQS